MRQPLLNGKSMGPRGAYELLGGRVHFTTDPKLPLNRAIADIQLAPTDSAGQVQTDAAFEILRPLDPGKANGSVILEIVNRGHPLLLMALQNGARTTGPIPSEAQLGDRLLLEQGFTIAWIGWQFDIRAGRGLDFHTAVANVHGPVRAAIIEPSGETRTQEASLKKSSFYCAADPSGDGARLTKQHGINDRPVEIERTEWSLSKTADGHTSADPCTLHLNGGFEPGALYQFVYTGESPPIAGLGLAAVRDFASYLKFGGIDSVLREHPETMRNILGYGYSQSARFLRTFLRDGFNQDEGHRPVFNGLLIMSAGAGYGSFNHRYAMPGEAGNSVLSILRPVDIFPFSDVDETDPILRKTAGMLDRSKQEQAVPKMITTLSSTEYWARAASLLHTSVDGRHDLALDPHSRIYFIAGTQHFEEKFPPTSELRGEHFRNPFVIASQRWAVRALLMNLQAWVHDGVSPPPSLYPTLHDRTLTAFEALHPPAVPAFPFPAYMPHVWRMDFGPDFTTTGVATVEPPHLGAPYPLLVPVVDRDGNEVSGIRLPHVAVPLGTYTGWNFSLPALPALEYLGGLAGSFSPFTWSSAERQANGDSRQSIVERYPSRQDYLDRVGATTRTLAEQRYLLKSDIPHIVEESAAWWDYFSANKQAEK